jgi:serine protease Do
MYNKKSHLFIAFISSIITAVFFLGIYFYILNPNTDSVLNQNTAQIFDYDQAIIQSVKKVNPAVVSIAITKDIPIIEQYFERFGPFRIPYLQQRGTERVEVGGGSGFFVSADGSIITNKHVVDDPSAEYTVFTNDGKRHIATVTYRHPTLDIALIKIPGNNYDFLEFEDSDNLEVGQTVIAIGNALAEFRNTVSVGVVSGLGRSITAGTRLGGPTEVLSHLIQTDAAINQGNSGGPLLNIQGKVIGVNVAIAAEAQNIGFALASNNVKEVLEVIN